MRKTCVIGAGAWGTALGVVLADNGRGPILWDRDEATLSAVRDQGVSPKLPGVPLPPGLGATADVSEALSGAGLVVSAVPSTALGEVSSHLARLIPDDAFVVSATKGFDPSTFRRPTEVWVDANPSLASRMVALSGPNFALEIAKRLPAATVVASQSQDAAEFVQAALVTHYLRVYTVLDVAGVELGGALKNITALACGLVEGMELGYNAQAAIISRGIAEITRLGVALGADPFTFAGLSGVGDLVLTSTGHLSRNRQAGIAVGRGESIDSFLHRTGYTVEGLATVKSALALARDLDISMPICETVHRILYENVPVARALTAIMTRERRPEREH